VLSLATGFFVTIISEKLASQKLDASIGASGPHDFAVRLSAVRQRRLCVHRIPLHVRDDRETPLVWDGMEENKPVIWVACEADYFSRDYWTGQISLKWLKKFGCAPHGETDPATLADVTPAQRLRRCAGVTNTCSERQNG
jgi:hypothetical protein